MALRIGGGMPQIDATSQPAVMPMMDDETEQMDMPGIEPMPEMVPEVEDPSMSGGTGRVSQESARYFGPEYRCAGCVHFTEGAETGECEIVAGPIDPDGVCSLFDPDVDALSGASEAEPPIDEEAV